MLFIKNRCVFDMELVNAGAEGGSPPIVVSIERFLPAEFPYLSTIEYFRTLSKAQRETNTNHGQGGMALERELQMFAAFLTFELKTRVRFRDTKAEGYGVSYEG
jgi:hypothetical protein